MESWRIVWVALASLLVVGILMYTPSIPTLFGSVFLMAFAAWYADRSPVTHLIPRGRAVVITGCDTGFGFEMAHDLDARGLIVFAGFYDINSAGAKLMKENCSERVHILQMDVTKDDEVNLCVVYVEKHIPQSGLWGVINNAAVHVVGDIELMTMKHISYSSEVNILGAVRITKAFLHLLRRTKGRVVMISSVRGLIPTIFGAAYNMTKHAMETFSDILRMEMKKFGVSVCVVEPCAFGAATNTFNIERMTKDFDEMWDEMNEETREVYGKIYLDFHLKTVKARKAGGGGDIRPVLRAIRHALLAIAPKNRYLVSGGWKDMLKPFAMLCPFLPQFLIDWYSLNKVKTFALPATLQE